MKKEDVPEQIENYLEKARHWILKAQTLQDKYNLESDVLAGLGCTIDDAIGQIKENQIE